MSCWRVEEGQDKDDWCRVGVLKRVKTGMTGVLLCVLEKVKTRMTGVLLSCVLARVKTRMTGVLLAC